MNKKVGTPYFYTVDLMRFCAAVMVTVFHLGYSTWSKSTSMAAPLVAGRYQLPELIPYAWWGGVGVEIFFVISGLVIAGSANGSTALSFLKSRLERLYPAVWICAPITAAVWFFSGRMETAAVAERLIRSLTLFPMGPWIDGTYWTLPCEIFFYFLIWIVLLAGGFSRIDRFATALGLFCAAFNLLHFLGVLKVVSCSWTALFVSGSLKPLLFSYGSFFAFGIFLWLSRVGQLEKSHRIPFLITAIGCCLPLGMKALIQASRSELQNPDAPWIGFLPLLIWLTACGIMHLSWNPQPPVQRLVRTLGLMTYPLYLLHFTLGVWAMSEMVHRGTPPLAAFFTAIVGLTGLSWLVAVQGEPAVRKVFTGRLNALVSAYSSHPRLRFLSRPGGTVPVSSASS